MPGRFGSQGLRRVFVCAVGVRFGQPALRSAGLRAWMGGGAWAVAAGSQAGGLAGPGGFAPSPPAFDYAEKNTVNHVFFSAGGGVMGVPDPPTSVTRHVVHSASIATIPGVDPFRCNTCMSSF